MSLINMRLERGATVALRAATLNNAPLRRHRPAGSRPFEGGRIVRRTPARAGSGSQRHDMAENAELLQSSTAAAAVATVRLELATLITRALNLEVAPADIDPAAPLYRDGLGLDSIDILEVALVISKEYGIQLKADSEENHVIFSSLNALSEFVAGQRTK
jgi:acyl carrier protein